MTLKALIDRALAENAPRTALVCGAFSLTYAELDRASRAAAAQLRELGAERGDRVALLLRNGLEFPVYDLAILRSGLVKVPLNDMLSEADVAHAIEHSGAKVFVTDDIAEIVTDRDVPLADDEVLPEHPAALFYTGGTTGKPKGVLHSQRSLALNQISTHLEAEIGRDERLLLTTPLPHAAGLFTLAGVLRGATVVIEPRFDVDAALAAIEAHAITWTFMVPTMIYRLLDSGALDRHDTSTLRTILYGAAPIDPGRLVAALDAFGPAFIQLYAQTECPNFATTLSKGDHVRAREEPGLLLSCGRPVLMTEVSVRDDDGAQLGPDEVGEVCLRGPYVMDGYWGDPDATAERFHGDWLRTGDVAAVDAEGYLYLKDRRSDMVISGGMNVYSAVVERVVADAPGVAQAAVIGIPDNDWGESVHAVVVAGPDGVSEDAVIDHCRSHLASYMRPKSMAVVDSLPLTAYGKVDKKALRAPYWRDKMRQIG